MINVGTGYWVILKKEIIDNLRDRRTLTTMVFSIAIVPVIMFGFLWFAEKTVKDETNPVSAKPIELPVVGAHHAPNLMAWLKKNNIDILDPPDDVPQAILKGQYRAVLVVDESYTQALAQGKTAPIQLMHDSSISGLEKLGFHVVQRSLRSYSALLGSLRLQARGINPQITHVLAINISDVALPSARNTEILRMMPYLMILFIMVGGLYLAIDTTAGERENGSLEPLLTLPVSRCALVGAKLSATAVFSALTFLLVLVGLALSFRYIPIESINIVIDLKKISIVFVTCLPFVFVASSLMVVMASFTKSYKEAQSYLGMMMLIPSLPLVVLGFLSPEPSMSNMWVPSLSQGLIIIDVLKGDVIAPKLIMLSMLSSLLFAALLAWVAVKLYQRERILG